MLRMICAALCVAAVGISSATGQIKTTMDAFIGYVDGIQTEGTGEIRYEFRWTGEPHIWADFAYFKVTNIQYLGKNWSALDNNDFIHFPYSLGTDLADVEFTAALGGSGFEKVREGLAVSGLGSGRDFWFTGAFAYWQEQDATTRAALKQEWGSTAWASAEVVDLPPSLVKRIVADIDAYKADLARKQQQQEADRKAAEEAAAREAEARAAQEAREAQEAQERQAEQERQQQAEAEARSTSEAYGSQGAPAPRQKTAQELELERRAAAAERKAQEARAYEQQLEAQRAQSRQAAAEREAMQDEMARQLVAAVGAIDVRQADEEHSYLYYSRVASAFNQSNFGISSGSQWGSFIFNADLYGWTHTFNGFELVESSESNLTSQLQNGDLYWDDFQDQENRIYRPTELRNWGGGGGLSMGFRLPLGKTSVLRLTGTGFIEVGTNEMFAHGHRYGVDLEFGRITFGVQYGRITYWHELNQPGDEWTLLMPDPDGTRSSVQTADNVNYLVPYAGGLFGDSYETNSLSQQVLRFRIGWMWAKKM